MGSPEKGKENHPPPYQRTLEDKDGPITLSWFVGGTAFWPAHGAMGYLDSPINAKPIDNTVKGLKGFRACTNYTLRLDGKFHTFRAETTFGAYSKNERTHTIK